MAMDSQELKQALGAGLLSFPVTPFTKDGEFNEKPYLDHVGWLSGFDASVLFAAGGTGEFFSIGNDEYDAVIRTAVDNSAPEVPVLAGVGYGTRMAVDLAKRHGTRLHVLHLTTARELALFEDKPLAHKRITAEVCLHHLLFDDRDYAALGNQIKCNPAIKTQADRDALRQALASHRLDVIGSDHAPHTWAEKQRAYQQAPLAIGQRRQWVALCAVNPCCT